jgi:predicted MFS family arabinose efflux permease
MAATQQARARTPSARTEHRAVVIVTGAFWSMLLCANLATPLYAVYSKQFGFSPAILALIFALYALVLMPSLVAFGQLSDRLGRRKVIAAGLFVQVGALVVFATAGGVVWLFLARALQGLAQGMMSGAATASLAELLSGRGSRTPAMLATLAQSGGSASGPLIAGMLAQWVVDPEVLPFLVGMAICVAMVVALATVPDSGTGARGWRIRRPEVPREIRADFARVGITAAAVWAVAGGLFLSVIPSYAADVFHTRNLALLGLLTAVLLVTSCSVQLLVRRGAPPVPAQAGGLALLALGLLALVLAHWVGPGLLIVGAVLAGAGHGLAFLAAQDNLTQIAPDERRAEVSAAFYVCIYLGVAVPVIGIGVLASLSSLFTAIAVFSMVTGSAALITAAWHLRHRTSGAMSSAVSTGPTVG